MGDVASVVWDLFFLDGEVVLYCTALALLRIVESRLLSHDGRDLEGCVKILGEELREKAADPDEVLLQVHEVWRRAPQQLLAEIRNIENTEFSSTSTYQYNPASMPSSGPVRALMTAWRSTGLGRWWMS